MPLLIYCKIGKRCIRAMDQLVMIGFHHIIVLDRGIGSLKAHIRRRQEMDESLPCSTTNLECPLNRARELACSNASPPQQSF